MVNSYILAIFIPFTHLSLFSLLTLISFPLFKSLLSSFLLSPIIYLFIYYILGFPYRRKHMINFWVSFISYKMMIFIYYSCHFAYFPYHKHISYASISYHCIICLEFSCYKYLCNQIPLALECWFGNKEDWRGQNRKQHVVENGWMHVYYWKE